jgi:hypothetical protein
MITKFGFEIPDDDEVALEEYMSCFRYDDDYEEEWDYDKIVAQEEAEFMRGSGAADEFWDDEYLID